MWRFHLRALGLGTAALTLAAGALAQTPAAPSAGSPPPALAPNAAAPADPLALRISQGFANSVYGQVHYLTARPDPSVPKAKWKTPLVMFHQSPLSAREFGPLIAEMARDRVVIAFDSPGQGLSDGPDRPVRMAQFAAVMARALAQMGYGPGRRVDVFGNHTGVWVGAELALHNPRLVRRIVFSGIYVVPETVWRDNIAHLTIPASNGDFFDAIKNNLTASRARYMANGMSDADWGRMIVDSLTPRRAREFAHTSAFSYAEEAEARLPLITQPVTVLLIDDGISDATRRSLPLLKTLNKVVEHMDWKEGLFYTRTAEVAGVLRGALD